MCTGVEPLALAALYTALAGTAVATYSAVEQGREAKDNADYQAGQAEADGNAQAAEGRVQAAAIRKQGARQRAAAVADQAASGVDVGEGSAIQVQNQMTTDVEHDAILATLDGTARQQNAYGQAAALRVQGANAQRAGYISGSATALSGAAAAYKAGYGGTGPAANKYGDVSSTYNGYGPVGSGRGYGGH